MAHQNAGPILTLTLNPSLDVNTSVDSVIPERKLRCAEPVREPGGGGLNVARALSNLGGDATALVVAGGRTGELLIDLLAQSPLRVVVVRAAGETRESVNVYEHASTMQYRFIMPGAPASADLMDRVIGELDRLGEVPHFLIASGSMPPGLGGEANRRLAEWCSSRRVRFVIDTSRDALRDSIGKGVFLIKPNIDEFRALIGDPNADDRRIESAAREMIASGATEHVVVSLGSGGVIASDGRQVFRVPAPAVRIASKVGAGDSTVAGIVLALTRGFDFRDAVHFGVAAGAAAVMTDGTELCRREDTERLYEQMK